MNPKGNLTVFGGCWRGPKRGRGGFGSDSRDPTRERVALDTQVSPNAEAWRQGRGCPLGTFKSSFVPEGTCPSLLGASLPPYDPGTSAPVQCWPPSGRKQASESQSLRPELADTAGPARAPAAMRPHRIPLAAAAAAKPASGPGSKLPAGRLRLPLRSGWGLRSHRSTLDPLSGLRCLVTDDRAAWATPATARVLYLPSTRAENAVTKKIPKRSEACRTARPSAQPERHASVPRKLRAKCQFMGEGGGEEGGGHSPRVLWRTTHPREPRRGAARGATHSTLALLSRAGQRANPVAFYLVCNPTRLRPLMMLRGAGCGSCLSSSGDGGAARASLPQATRAQRP